MDLNTYYQLLHVYKTYQFNCFFLSFRICI